MFLLWLLGSLHVYFVGSSHVPPLSAGFRFHVFLSVSVSLGSLFSSWFLLCLLGSLNALSVTAGFSPDIYGGSLHVFLCLLASVDVFSVPLWILFTFFQCLWGSLHVLAYSVGLSSYAPCVASLLSTFAVWILSMFFQYLLGTSNVIHVFLQALSMFPLFLQGSFHVFSVSARFSWCSPVCWVLLMFSLCLFGFSLCSLTVCWVLSMFSLILLTYLHSHCVCWLLPTLSFWVLSMFFQYLLCTFHVIHVFL